MMDSFKDPDSDKHRSFLYSLRGASAFIHASNGQLPAEVTRKFNTELYKLDSQTGRTHRYTRSRRASLWWFEPI